MAFIVPLHAEMNVNTNTAAQDKPIPNVPSFDFSYKGENLSCYPSSLIETKTKKNFVEFVCVQRNLAKRLIPKTNDVSSQEDRGRQETKRLQQAIKDQKNIGSIYYVKIPEGEAKYPSLAAYEAKHVLDNNYYFGKFVRWLLPAKFYISLRPQYADIIGVKDDKHFHNAGSRAGFFYFYEFNNGMNLTLQYEATVEKKYRGKFINLSDKSDSNRRLSYISLDYKDITLLVGKYWSAYYDVAGLTDYFMAFGAQASGAYNNSSDGSDSGTGRVDRMFQTHYEGKNFETTMQYQYAHNGPAGLNGRYSYSAGGSYMYNGWEEEGWIVGAAFSYATFHEITAEMYQAGIRGNDQSYITGFSFHKDRFLLNANLSYTKNHMNDDQGIYFYGTGVEIYARYDVSDQIRTVAGLNWLHPTGDYQGQYEIKKGILSFQYTFGQKTFDDIVYLEIALPHGSSAKGIRANTSIAIGLRYLIDL